MSIPHDEITAVMSAQGGYGKGIRPNPYAEKQDEWTRRIYLKQHRELLTDKIESLFEPRFISPPETAECIEAIVTMTGARRILEIGMHTGFTSLHILRAIMGKPSAKLVSVDARPAHDREFFERPEIAPWFQFVEGWTPDVINTLPGLFEMVFIDSDHGLEPTKKEIEALWSKTMPGTIFLFHDLPAWHRPDDRVPPPIRTYLLEQVGAGVFYGVILPSVRQLDGLAMWGDNYPMECNPHLGVFIRR